MEQILYIAFEATASRLERTNKRMWILCIILVFLLLGTNVAWIIYESQFEDIVVEQEVDTGMGDATVSGVGDISYGQSETDR